MKKIKVAGLCLVAVFALAAVTASGAFAAEATYVHCASVGKKHGKYSNSSCTTIDEKKGKDEGSFEIATVKSCENVGKKKGKYSDSSCTTLDEKKGKDKGSFEKTAIPVEATSPTSVLETPELHGPNVECTGGLTTGTITGPKEALESVEFTGCQLAGAPCNSNGAPEGTPSKAENAIHTNELAVTLRGAGETVNGFGGKTAVVPAGEIWTEVNPAKAGGLQAEFSCPAAGAFIKTGGNLNGVTTPVNAGLSIHSTVEFSKEKGISGLATEVGASFAGPFEGPFESIQNQVANITSSQPIENHLS